MYYHAALGHLEILCLCHIFPIVVPISNDDKNFGIGQKRVDTSTMLGSSPYWGADEGRDGFLVWMTDVYFVRVKQQDWYDQSGPVL